MLRETFRLIDCTKKQEYDALSVEAKEWYKIFVSIPLINLNPGSKAHTALWSMFPANTQTGREIRDWKNGLVARPSYAKSRIMGGDHE